LESHILDSREILQFAAAIYLLPSGIIKQLVIAQGRVHYAKYWACGLILCMSDMTLNDKNEKLN